MKRFFLFLSVIISASSVVAQYKPTDQGSVVQFKIKNLGFNVNGSFSGLAGNIQFDPAHPDQCHFDVSLDAASVNTDNSMRDEHLQKDNYFDVKTYPRIHFQSTKILPADKAGAFIISGKLTIKNTTKEISFSFTATASQTGYVFKGSFRINRKDFQVGGSSTISDELDLMLNITAVKS
jgi:polyisoprenoid-binding protein YceI